MNNNEKFIKQNIRNLFRWEGFEKEFIWILFLISILLAGYGYYDLKQKFDALHTDNCTGKCIWDCRTLQIIENMQEEYPGAIINCDYKTKRCLISGYKDPKYDTNWNKLVNSTMNAS